MDDVFEKDREESEASTADTPSEGGTAKEGPAISADSHAGEDTEAGDSTESNSWNTDSESSTSNHRWRPSSESIIAGEDATIEIKVAVDWIELEGALENNSPELHSFLNTVTGDVIRIFEGGENAETRLKQSEASPDYFYIEPVSSRDQYRWMEEFIETVEESTLKDKLNIAIDGKGAFRRFKDVLVGYPSEREKWFAIRSSKLREHMDAWLKSKHIGTTNTPPWEGEPQDGEEDPTRGDSETKSWYSPSPDLRTQAHELLDMVPSRELPTAVAFLEFLKGRRMYKRPRYS